MISSDPSYDLIEIGFVRGAHGLKGYVLVHVYSKDEESLVGYGDKVIQDKDGSRHFTFSVQGSKGQDFLCAVDGITDRNAAEEMRGTKLYIPSNQLPPLEGDEYYVRDLIGLTIQNEAGVELGHVIDVLTLGAHDALEITFNHNGQHALPVPQTEYLLMTHQNVGTVDLSARKITITLPDGLLDDPEE
jgi:16S rRNA processing protein RimM